MSKYDYLLKELENFKNSPSHEIELKDLEKKLFNHLGMVREKKKGKGSVVVYSHPALKAINEHGHLTIHKIHGKKREIMRKINFKNYTYNLIKFIIEHLETENSGSEKE